MSFDAAKWVWMNGRCVRWDEATVHVSAHALHYGSGVFEGVTRDAVIRIARGLGFEVETCALTPEDLRTADEVTPVRELDGTAAGSGARGPVTERIQRTFFDATSGRDERYAHWLGHVAAQPARSSF